MKHSHTERRMRPGQAIEVNGAVIECVSIDDDPTTPKRSRVTLRIGASNRVRVLVVGDDETNDLTSTPKTG